MQYTNNVVDSIDIDYTRLLFGSYTENTVWYKFFECITAVFKLYFEPKLKRLAGINDYEISDREVNVNNATDCGFIFKNDLFTNEEYVRLLYVLRQYQQKKGTNYYLDLIGVVKGAHFTAFPLWTKDYITFERNSEFVKQNSILTKYTRIYDNTSHNLDYGLISEEAVHKVDYGWIYDNASDSVSYGSIPEYAEQGDLPDINKSSYYEDKYYPTSHVDLEFDFGKFPIDDSDVHYLFYKVAPAQLVLGTVSGVYYCDEGSLYLLHSKDCHTIFTDTIPVWAQYEGMLYTWATHRDYDLYTSGRTVCVLDGVERDISWFFMQVYYGNLWREPTKYLPANWVCYRNTAASYVTKDRLGYNMIETVPANTIRIAPNRGILLEGEATNYIPYSNVIGTKTIMLDEGTYVYKSFGFSGKTKLSGAIDVTLDINEFMSFSVSNPTELVIEPDPKVQVMQLTDGKIPTSPIITNAKDLRRVSDTYICTDENIVNSTLFFKFLKDTVDYNECFVLGYGRDFANCVNIVRRMREHTPYVVLEVVDSGVKQEIEIGTLLLGVGLLVQISPNENSYDVIIKIGKETYTNTVSLQRTPNMIRLGTNWLGNNPFNGYLTYFFSVQ